MRKVIVVGVLALLFGLAIQAQTAVPTSEIPDSVIIRLWLDMHTYNNQVTIPSDAQLTSADTAVLTGIMGSYRTQLNALQGPYNAAVAAGGSFNRTAYWNSINSLVAAAMLSIQTELSQAGAAQFSSYIQAKRPQANVSPFDPGLGIATVERNRKEHRMVASMKHMMAGQSEDGMTPNYSSLVDGSENVYSYIDTFDRANGSPGSPWVASLGTFAISSDSIEVTNGGSGGTAFMYYNNTFGTDQCNNITLTAIPGSGASIGVTARASTNGETAYFATFYSGSQVVLFKILNNEVTNLGAYGYTSAVGDQLQVCAMGKTISAVLNGSQVVSVTDSSITSGYAGMEGTESGGTANNWVSASFGGMVVTAEIEGDTTCSGTCPTAIHTPSIQNTDGTYGGESIGTGVPPAEEIQFQYGVNYPQASLELPGEGMTFSLEVECSIVGAIWTWATSKLNEWLQVEEAWTYLKNTEPVGSQGPWIFTAYCNSQTSPPDFIGSGNYLIPPFIPIDYDYWSNQKAFGNCERGGIGSWRIPSGGGWICEPGFTNPVTLPVQSQAWCVYWDGSYNGIIRVNTGGPQP